MSYKGLLINRCNIERYVAGIIDAYGNPTQTWGTLHTNIPCRHVTGTGTEVKLGARVIMVYDQLFVEDIDVTNQDRVVIGGKTYNILSVLFRQDGTGGHHKQLMLEIVK